jgi:hypothetical protein
MMLRDWMHGETLTPLQNNLVAVACAVIYTKIGLECIASLRLTKKFEELEQHSSSSYSKCMVYILLCTSLLFWPLFDESDGWSWRLNSIVPCAMGVRFIYKGAVCKDPEDVEVQTLSRSCSPTHLLFGPLQLTLVLTWLGLFRFRTEEAAISASILVGDAATPLIGNIFGRHKFHVPLGQPKTMEGSVCGVFCCSVSAIYFFLYFLSLPLLPLRTVLAYAAIAAFAEGTAPANLDNLTVPLVMHFSIDRVQLWIDRIQQWLPS